MIKVTVTTTAKPISCATIIPLTESDYNQLISEASTSLSASGTHYQTQLGTAGIATTEAAAGSSATSGASITGTTASGQSQPTASASGNVGSGHTERLELVVGAGAGLAVALGALLV